MILEIIEDTDQIFRPLLMIIRLAIHASFYKYFKNEHKMPLLKLPKCLEPGVSYETQSRSGKLWLKPEFCFRQTAAQ